MKTLLFFLINATVGSVAAATSVPQQWLSQQLTQQEQDQTCITVLHMAASTLTNRFVLLGDRDALSAAASWFRRAAVMQAQQKSYVPSTEVEQKILALSALAFSPEDSGARQYCIDLGSRRETQFFRETKMGAQSINFEAARLLQDALQRESAELLRTLSRPQ